MTKTYIKKLFSEKLPPAPMGGRGLKPDDEKLWFKRLAAAKIMAAKPGNRQKKWQRRLDHCRAFITGSNTGIALRIMGIFSKASAFNASKADDINSAAHIALWRAVEGFRLNRGFKFSTYAYSAIKKEVSRTLGKEAKQSIRFVSETTYFSGKQQGDTSNEGLSGFQMAANESIATTENVEALNRAMQVAKLTNVENTVIDQRFRLNLTLEDVGKVIGVTKERVRQIQNKALAKLRVAMEEGSEAA